MLYNFFDGENKGPFKEQAHENYAEDTQRLVLFRFNRYQTVLKGLLALEVVVHELKPGLFLQI